MSPHLLSLLILSTLLAYSTGNQAINPHLKEVKLIVAIEGMVYCQSCQQAGSWSLAGAKPLHSATVGVSCKDYKNRVTFYKAVQTNSRGYFYVLLHLSSATKNYYLDYKTEACTARLLSSPDPKCNLLTNINYGINGSQLHDDNKRVLGKGYIGVVYTAGPMAFRSANCPLDNHPY